MSVIIDHIRGTIELAPASYPAALTDGHTVAWYMASDLSTITKDGSDLISQWNDKLGSGHDLIQATGSMQPLWTSDGVLFDGSDDFMKTVTFTYEQPEMIYIVFKLIDWVAYMGIFDGYAGEHGCLYEHWQTPMIDLNVGTGLIYNATYNVAVGDWGIIRALINGASSKLIANDWTPATGDAGSNDLSGITLGANGYGNAAHVQIKEVICRDIADSSGDEAVIYSYLANKYSIS